QRALRRGATAGARRLNWRWHQPRSGARDEAARAERPLYGRCTALPFAGPASPHGARSRTIGQVLLPVGDRFGARLIAPRQSRQTRQQRLHRLLRRKAHGAAVVAAAVMAMAGCAGGDIGANTPASSGQSFVGHSYESTYYQAASRPAAPPVSGTTL